ncbi:MAG: transporter permease [Rhodoglobus sp.]|nr:transporter permease [Rhodoglobus sp.]
MSAETTQDGTVVRRRIRTVKTASTAVSSWLIPTVIVLVGLLIWQLSSGTLIDDVFVSSPLRVIVRIWQFISTGAIFPHAATTLGQSALGFLLGAVGGIAVGNLLGLIPTLNRSFGPILTFFYTLPRIAIAPLFVIWFGIGAPFKVMFVMFVIFFMFQAATVGAIRTIDASMVNGIRVMGASRWALFRKAIIPQELLWIGTTVKVAAPMAVATDIVGEFVAANEGLGFLMRNAASVLDTTTLLAVVVILATLVTAFLGIFGAVERHLFRWNDTPPSI